jgi:hypothetical protein
MKCSDFEKAILQLAGSELMEASTRTAALRHSEVCARCAARLVDERVLISGVRAVRRVLGSEQAPAHLEQVLLNAFRERGTASVVPMPRRNLHWANWRVAAIAAVLVLAGSIGTIVFVRSVPREEPSPPKAQALPSAPDSPVTKATATEKRDELVAISTPRRRSTRRTPRPETVTEFFPLNEGDDLESLEFTQIVRVELTPSALREVGLPLSYASDRDAVKADLVLGEDGVARAIRFVR